METIVVCDSWRDDFYQYERYSYREWNNYFTEEEFLYYQNLFQILSSTFIEIGLFTLVVLFVYYTDETIFHLSQRPHINGHNERNYSNIEMFFVCLRLLFDVIRLFHS